MNRLERVSRAICKAHGFDPDDADATYILRPERTGRPLWEAYEPLAMAAIITIEIEC